MLLFLLLSLFTIQDRDTPVTIKESGYYLAPKDNGCIVNIAVIVSNPYEDKFASYPEARVTFRAKDNSVINVRNLHGAGIVPKGEIAICESISLDTVPAIVQITPLAARYQETVFRSSDFKPFSIINAKSRVDRYGTSITLTGEIENPYKKETGVWIVYLQRNKVGRLLGGHSYWLSTVDALTPTPYDFHIDTIELSPELGKVDAMVFSHNNEQSSWQKILGK